MSKSNGALEHVFSIAAAILVAVAGAVAGGTIYISISGAIVGALVALSILAALAIVLAALGLFGKAEDTAARPTSASTESAIGTPAVTAIDSTLPSDAPIPAQKIEATESEARLLAAGRFAEYHLAKAQRLLAAGNPREAAHQAAASLAHGHLTEAVTIRQRARQRAA